MLSPKPTKENTMLKPRYSIALAFVLIGHGGDLQVRADDDAALAVMPEATPRSVPEHGSVCSIAVLVRFVQSFSTGEEPSTMAVCSCAHVADARCGSVRVAIAGSSTAGHGVAALRAGSHAGRRRSATSKAAVAGTAMPRVSAAIGRGVVRGAMHKK